MDEYYAQIFHTIDVGLVMLDKDLRVQQWSRWMEQHSSIPFHKIIGRPLFDFFPELDHPRFLMNFKMVVKFGNSCFLSQKLNKYLSPFKPAGAFAGEFEYMQQSCAMFPLRDEKNALKYICISVNDVTETVACETRLVEMNVRDGLTGIYNRKFLEAKLTEELDRSKRYGRAFSVIMIDIDHFKKVNDSYGHSFGDTVLKSTASMLQSGLRTTDFLTRYGGEEFCCLLPETECSSAVIVAERMRANAEALALTHGGNPVNISISLGVAGATAADTPSALIVRADEALYTAKKSGRNKVVASQGRAA